MEVLDGRNIPQGLCESRGIVDNLEPAAARIVHELQRQINKLKGELSFEKHKSRALAKDHLSELKRLREEHERRLESSLDALNARKDQEKTVELKRMEEQLVKRRESEVKYVNKEKTEELKALERRLQRRADENLRLALERQRREIYEDVEAARIPDEQEAAKRQMKLMKEVFDLGEENMKLEDQVRNLAAENRSQIEQLRRMKQEHKAEVDHILRQTKVDAARDMARIKLAEQAILERDSDLLEICQRVETAELEREQLEAEVSVLKIVHENSFTNKPNDLKKTSSSNMAVLKKVEDLESTLRKLEEEKINLKQENASLRKKMVQTSSESDSKGRKEMEDEIKRLRKRNTELSNMTKLMDERVQLLKNENKRMHERQQNSNTEIEQSLRKNLSRQHAKDISEYTRKIASRDREVLELKRRLSKYEVSSDAARHEPASELDKKVKMMAMERIKMEKLMAKMYNVIPDTADIELYYADVCNDTNRLQVLSEENSRLRTELHELQQPSEVDSGMKGTKTFKNGEHISDLEAVRELREENQRLHLELQELYPAVEERNRLVKELKDSEMASSTAERRLKMLQEDLEQARLLSEEHERVRDHCTELEKEISEIRGQLNDRDREICQSDLENKTKVAMIQEKGEEIDMLKESVLSLKNELRQNEDLVRELQTELESLTTPTDTNNIGLQTSPYAVPNMYPRSSQTSPIKSTSNSITRLSDPKLLNLPENSLQSELMAAGMTLSDPFTNEPMTNSEDFSIDLSETSLSGKPAEITGLTTSTTSLTESDQQLVNSKLFIDSYTPKHDSEGNVPSLYIASDDYDPHTLSPNPDNSLELCLSKGDYVYVYGEEREDGYLVGRLVSGAKGLVPSDYVRKLTDHSSNDTSSVETDQLNSSTILSPPLNLELNRQFVDNDTDCYCLSITWDRPCSLPANAKGYNVYINGTLDSTVPLTAETSVLLSGIPRNQYTCVTVRTVSDEGKESGDPAKLVEINLQYPLSPSKLSSSSDGSSVRLHWPRTPPTQIKITPSSPKTKAGITAYKVFLNKTILIKTTPISEVLSLKDNNIGVEITSTDFENISESDLLDLTTPYYVTVQSYNNIHSSPHSNNVVLTGDMLSRLLPLMSHDSGATTSSELSLLSNGGGRSYNTDSQSQYDDEGITEVHIGEYYKAIYTYDPRVSSPNQDGLDEELSFEENDIIQAIGSLDEDGFFMGDKDGERGLVPKNMVEHVEDDTLIADVNHINTIHDNNSDSSLSSSSIHVLNNPDYKLVQALYDYNPLIQSQNPNPEEELTFHEGDYIYVRKFPLEDGFYEGELKGQSGLVPMTFVTAVSSSDIINKISNLSADSVIKTES